MICSKGAKAWPRQGARQGDCSHETRPLTVERPWEDLSLCRNLMDAWVRSPAFFPLGLFGCAPGVLRDPLRIAQAL